jgi:hypothetical protein
MRNGGHSAQVRMELFLDGQVLPIAQFGPDFLILEKPADHSPTNGEILMSIDGHERRWTVYLPDGLVAGQLKTRIAPSR